MQTAILLPSIEEQTSFRNGSQQNTTQHHQQHMGHPNKYNQPCKNPPVYFQICSFRRKEKKELQQIRLSAFS